MVYSTHLGLVFQCWRSRRRTVSSATFVINPGDIVLAENTIGSGHTCQLIDGDPWRRTYVILAETAAVPFKKA